jgi:hypothetical protein
MLTRAIVCRALLMLEGIDIPCHKVITAQNHITIVKNNKTIFLIESVVLLILLALNIIHNFIN